jgi:hypothetical protein
MNEAPVQSIVLSVLDLMVPFCLHGYVGTKADDCSLSLGYPSGH